MISNRSMMSNLKVLCVEDEEITRIILKKILKNHFGKVIMAENGQEGYDEFLKQRPQMIITDLRMPQMGGIEMVQRIRAVDPDCGIIITSEIEDVELILKSVDLGIDKYLVKPIKEEPFLRDLEIVTAKIIRRKLGSDEGQELVFTDNQHKKELEDQIKKKFASFIKEKTGKGPLDIQVFVLGDSVEIKSFGGLTIYEMTFLGDERFTSLVEYNRKAFYDMVQAEIEGLVEGIMGKSVTLADIKIKTSEQLEQLTLKIEF